MQGKAHDTSCTYTQEPVLSMSQASKSPGLFKRWLARPVQDDQDAADLGTCIGLEVSLDQPPEPPQSPPGPQGQGWMQRLRGRSRTTE